MGLSYETSRWEADPVDEQMDKQGQSGVLRGFRFKHMHWVTDSYIICDRDRVTRANSEKYGNLNSNTSRILFKHTSWDAPVRSRGRSHGKGSSTAIPLFGGAVVPSSRNVISWGPAKYHQQSAEFNRAQNITWWTPEGIMVWAREWQEQCIRNYLNTLGTKSIPIMLEMREVSIEIHLCCGDNKR